MREKEIYQEFIEISPKDVKSLCVSGIYAIVNRMNEHLYIGQSKDIMKRWVSHKQALRKGNHGNAYLQNAWNYYTECNFKFAVVEFCELGDLDLQEQYWIERLNPEYNISRNVFKPFENCRPKNDYPDGYTKSGETFKRPQWHLWVYGGSKNPSCFQKYYSKRGF